MSAIIVCSDLLNRAELKPDQSKLLEYVNNSTQDLLNLINDILDFSKIEAGEMDLHLAPCNLGAVVQTAFETVSPLAIKKSYPTKHPQRSYFTGYHNRPASITTHPT